MANPYPTGTFTRQETPSLAWRTNNQDVAHPAGTAGGQRDNAGNTWILFFLFIRRNTRSTAIAPYRVAGGLDFELSKDLLVGIGASGGRTTLDVNSGGFSGMLSDGGGGVYGLGHGRGAGTGFRLLPGSLCRR
ncbi:MAG: hypothetical protein NTX45_24195 [Proteobacteria bacterium]|nr:hypothetical protein [Pseudomonadota bacterium]